MPRKGPIPKRDVLPDPIYKSKLVTKFINNVMMDGKRGLAQRTFYSAMDMVAERAGEDPLKVFETSLENVGPLLEVKSRRVGGATYQVPQEVTPHRKTMLAIRWIVASARRRGERTMRERLAKEFLDAYNNQGGSVKRKEEMHRMAEANKAFAHYRW